jgi:hypothetical protein
MPVTKFIAATEHGYHTGETTTIFWLRDSHIFGRDLDEAIRDAHKTKIFKNTPAATELESCFRQQLKASYYLPRRARRE